jgi:hypothetical protein
MISKPNLIFVPFFFLFFLFQAAVLSAEDITAEIININQDQKIVFVDLGRDVLSVGDIMSVEGVDHPVYLEVLETSDAVSKLRISKKEKFHSKTSDLDMVTIGMKVTRIASQGVEPHAAPADSSGSPTPPVQASSQQGTQASVPNNVSFIDQQAFVKPDISKESFQSLDERMNKMVGSNIKLLDALSRCQSAQGESQKLVAINDELKKQLDESNSKFVSAVIERDKYKKQAEDLQTKVNDLKARFDRLDSVIEEHLK